MHVVERKPDRVVVFLRLDAYCENIRWEGAGRLAIYIYCLKFKVIALAADKGNAPKVEIMRDNFVCIQNE